MKLDSLIVLACATHCACICCQGQTNQCSASALFFKPSVQLRQEKPIQAATPMTAAVPKPAAPAPETTGPAQLQLSSALYQGDLHSSFIRSDVFYLTQPEPEIRDDTARFVDQIYRPEAIHLGKATASFTLWTAIKHKNPLCFLLNPYVFEVWW